MILRVCRLSSAFWIVGHRVQLRILNWWQIGKYVLRSKIGSHLLLFLCFSYSPTLCKVYLPSQVIVSIFISPLEWLSSEAERPLLSTPQYLCNGHLRAPEPEALMSFVCRCVHSVQHTHIKDWLKFLIYFPLHCLRMVRGPQWHYPWDKNFGTHPAAVTVLLHQALWRCFLDENGC